MSSWRLIIFLSNYIPIKTKSKRTYAKTIMPYNRKKNLFIIIINIYRKLIREKFGNSETPYIFFFFTYFLMIIISYHVPIYNLMDSLYYIYITGREKIRFRNYFFTGRPSKNY